VSSEYRNLGLPFEISHEGNIGLIEAAHRYDASKGTNSSRTRSGGSASRSEGLVGALEPRSGPELSDEKGAGNRDAEASLRRSLVALPNAARSRIVCRKSVNKIDQVLQFTCVSLARRQVGKDRDKPIAEYLSIRMLEPRRRLESTAIELARGEAMAHLTEQERTSSRFRFGLAAGRR